MLGNNIQFHYSADKIDSIAAVLHLDAKKALGAGAIYEIRRKAIPDEIDLYKEAIRDFNTSSHIDEIDKPHIAKKFGIAWVSDSGMNGIEPIPYDKNARYDPKLNYALMGRFICSQ
jgi:hypothetical protein